MAKLHRRVPRLPHPHLSAEREDGTPDREIAAPAVEPAPERAHTIITVRAAAARALVVMTALLALLTPRALSAQDAPEVAQPGDPRLERLETLLSDLRSEDEASRRTAYEALITLDPEMLPAIRARVARVTRHRPEHAWAFDIFNRIRRAAGSERADDDVDMAPGVLPVLASDRSARVMQIVEPLLLWRALERMASFESCQAMYPLFGLDDGVWRWEERRILTRMGNDLMAAAIAGRNHPERNVRRWASEAMRRLGADDPGLAVQQLDTEQLADVLRAYAMLRMQSAMRVIVSYVDSDRRSTRRAARWAIEQYGGNAIWILRTEYRNQTGEHPPEQWGWRRVADALYAHVDAARMEPVRRAREAGLAALGQGDLDAMKAHFDDVLARAPDLEDAAPLARGYARLGDARLEEGRLADAARAYRRALRLAPEDEDAPRWRARSTLAGAERDARRGIVDGARYAEVLALEPTHEVASQRLALLAPPQVEAASDARSRWALVAAGLLALLGGGLLWRPRRAVEPVGALDSTVMSAPQQRARTDTPIDDALLAPTFDEADATLAD